MSFVETGIHYARMLAMCRTQPAEDHLRNHLQIMLNKAQALKVERDTLRTQLAEARELLSSYDCTLSLKYEIDAWLESTK